VTSATEVWAHYPLWQIYTTKGILYEPRCHETIMNRTTLLIRMQDKVFSLNLVLKYVRSCQKAQLGLCPSSNVRKKHNVFPSRHSSRFQAKMHLTWYNPSIDLFSINEHHYTRYLLRYAPENRSSPRVVTRK
jgi:hypothetical protein